MTGTAPLPPGTVLLVPLVGIPEVVEGTDLAGELTAALRRAGLELVDGDVLVVSSKVVSKALGLRVAGDGPEVRDRLVAEGTVRVVAERRAGDRVTRVVEAVAGPVMAAAGVDASNTGGGGALWLPPDPDEATATLRRQLGLEGRPVGVVLTDTAGRAWRAGQTDFALGAAGVAVLEDLRGAVDADGRELAVTARALADEVAAAADLVKGKVGAVPAALVRGLTGVADDGATTGARRLVRTGPGDWFGLGRAEAVRAALGVEPGSEESEQVGIAPVGGDTVRDRVARAVAVALHDCPEVGADVGPQDIRLVGSDELELGRATARVEVALRGEDLDPTGVRRTGDGVQLGWVDRRD